jgi:hypothetical protein
MAVLTIDPHDIHDQTSRRIETRVCTDGGWDVVAIVADVIVAIRPCDDWHRVERTQRRFAFELGIRSE